jgi:RNA polymerase sigma-70 factor (ECF subfamily)
VLLLRDVLGFSAREVAETLDTTVDAANSALARARRSLEQRLPERSQQTTLRALGDDAVREVVERYVDALDRGDVQALVAMLTEDASWSMPPLPAWYQGLDAITAFLETGPMPLRWRHRVTHANGQPAVGCYLWDEARGDHHGWVIDVLTLDGPRIAAVTSFIGHDAFARFGLPDALP